MPTDIVHALWVRGRPSKLIATCIATLPRSGCNVELYTYAPTDLPAFPGVTICDANQVIPQNEIFTYQHGSGKGSLAAFANLFRYVLLYKTGGWWLDADIYCLRPFDIPEPYFFGQEPGHPEWIHNGIIKVPPGSPIMHAAIAAARAIPQERLNWGDTGSRLCTRLMHQFPELKPYIKPAAYFCPWHWHDIVRLIQRPHNAPCPPSSRAVHLFHEMWRRHNLNTDQEYLVYSWLQAHSHE